MNRTDTFRILSAGVVLLLAQMLLFQNLPILGSRPDAVLLFTIWVATTHEKFPSLLYAALFSFLLDVLLDLWGLHLFSNVLLLLIGHRFLSDVGERPLLSWQLFLLLLIVALVKNIIFLSSSVFLERLATGSIFWTQLIISSAYTALAGVLIQTFRSP